MAKLHMCVMTQLQTLMDVDFFLQNDMKFRFIVSVLYRLLHTLSANDHTKPGFTQSAIENANLSKFREFSRNRHCALWLNFKPQWTRAKVHQTRRYLAEMCLNIHLTALEIGKFRS